MTRPDEQLTRVTFTYSFNVADPEAFLAFADRQVQACWGSTLEDVTGPDMPPLVQAAVEVFASSALFRGADGKDQAWPDGVADDLDCDYHGHVRVLTE